MADKQKLLNSERKDRSIRLWGERGQLALETGHICVLSATALATEVEPALDASVSCGCSRIVKELGSARLGRGFWRQMQN
jgi:hypothetical protein